VILNKITGVLQTGQVNCIMGASGAGKTSLLNILACRVSNSKEISVTGKIAANGRGYS
jgi:ABC-type multidrug transport system ATPase subunit